MIKINLLQTEAEQVKFERFHHPHPLVQKKMEVLWLKHLKYSHNQICEIVFLSKRTIIRYLKDFISGGLDKLREIKFNKPQSKLVEYSGTIKEYLTENPPGTIKEAVSVIENLSGFRRSETQVRKFLKSLGMKRIKVGTVPARADPEEQVNFKKSLDPRLKEAKENKRTVLFLDAAHFVHAPFIGFVWCLTRIIIKSPSGRQRFNVLGAINAISLELITVANTTYINAGSICEMLKKIKKQYGEKPITIILDNARYQKCKLVMELATVLNIGLLYLPTYSPNLNIIERLWKFVKNDCLYSIYYDNFAKFKQAIILSLEETQTKKRDKLKDMLTLNFQTFKKAV